MPGVEAVVVVMKDGVTFGLPSTGRGRSEPCEVETRGSKFKKPEVYVLDPFNSILSQTD